MFEPFSPQKSGVPLTPPKTPEKLAPLGEKLLSGKSLQKSPSLKGQLNFDQFISTSKPLASPQLPIEPNQVKLDQIEEAIGLLECGNRLLSKSAYVNSLCPPLRGQEIQLFAEERHCALTMLAAKGALPEGKAALGERAKQLALACLKNLTEPRYFEPPENIAPILSFYMQIHPQVDYQEIRETMDYLETCYEGGLDRYPNYRELKRSLK